MQVKREDNELLKKSRFEAYTEDCKTKQHVNDGLSEVDAWNKADRELKDEYRNQLMSNYGNLIQYMLCCSSLKLFCVVLLCAFTF